VAGAVANQEPFEPVPAHESQAEATLREQRARMLVTLGRVSDGVLTTDAEGRVTFLNHVAESLSGWTCHQAKGLPLESGVKTGAHQARATYVA
jgi:PAS domain-containing protein